MSPNILGELRDFKLVLQTFYTLHKAQNGKVNHAKPF